MGFTLGCAGEMPRRRGKMGVMRACRVYRGGRSWVVGMLGIRGMFPLAKRQDERSLCCGWKWGHMIGVMANILCVPRTELEAPLSEAEKEELERRRRAAELDGTPRIEVAEMGDGTPGGERRELEARRAVRYEMD